ncbi:hypothetical protein M3Y98_01219800 [Aphelenchoides besseyi]|nr:hypothetical protein M3Y98_01219800 [Aphelenchoides besseyi]
MVGRLCSWHSGLGARVHAYPIFAIIIFQLLICALYAMELYFDWVVLLRTEGRQQEQRQNFKTIEVGDLKSITRNRLVEADSDEIFEKAIRKFSFALMTTFYTFILWILTVWQNRAGGYFLHGSLKRYNLLYNINMAGVFINILSLIFHIYNHLEYFHAFQIFGQLAAAIICVLTLSIQKKKYVKFADNLKDQNSEEGRQLKDEEIETAFRYSEYSRFLAHTNCRVHEAPGVLLDATRVHEYVQMQRWIRKLGLQNESSAALNELLNEMKTRAKLYRGLDEEQKRLYGDLVRLDSMNLLDDQHLKEVMSDEKASNRQNGVTHPFNSTPKDQDRYDETNYSYPAAENRRLLKRRYTFFCRQGTSPANVAADGAVNNNRRFVARIVLFASPIYLIVLAAVVDEITSKGGIYMHQNFDCIDRTSCCFSLFALLWFAAIGAMLLIDGCATIVVTVTFKNQRKSYVEHLENIQVESALRGLPLNDEQTRSAYELQVHHRQISANGRRVGGGELDDGRVKAVHAEDYYNLQRWMFQMRSVKEIYDPEVLLRLIEQIHDEMLERSEIYVLNSNERRRYRQLAERLSSQTLPSASENAEITVQLERGQSLGRQLPEEPNCLQIPSYEMTVMATTRAHNSTSTNLILSSTPPPPYSQSRPPSYASDELGDAV